MGTEERLVVLRENRGRIGGTLALAALLLTIAGLAYTSRPARSGSRGATTPQVAVSTVVASAVERLRKQSKLVVLSAELTVHVTKVSEKRLLGLDLGTTRVSVSAPGKVQYYVPLDAVTGDSVIYRASARTLLVRIPVPRLDREMVSVESDPARVQVVKEIGWGRLEAYSGEFWEREARRELRARLLEAGEGELIREKAREEAKDAIRNLLAPILSEIEPPVTLEIELVASGD